MEKSERLSVWESKEESISGSSILLEDAHKKKDDASACGDRNDTPKD